MAERRGISSFSVVLLMAVAAVVGIACFSMLKVQYTPSPTEKRLSVDFSYPGASARTVEAEVTSKLEGVLSGIKSCTGISSVSNDGSGRVTLTVGKRSDMDAVRFEVASQIRNLYSRLPEGCTYPSISLNAQGQEGHTAIAFSIRSPLPSLEIAKYVEAHLLHPLSVIEGVSSVDFYGQTPFEWVVTFDADKAAAAGISATGISNAFTSYYSERLVGLARSGGNTFAVKLRSDTASDMAGVPVANIDGRIVHLGDLATFRYQEALPNSYYRVNGLNVLTLTVEASSDANLIDVVQSVKDCLASMEDSMPEEIGISVSYDYSEYISDELDKIYFRTGLCLLILLLFAFAVSRSWRYMVLIGITLAVNLLISVACYCLFGLHIHIYTLAGVTVSLGIIIDNSIVMIDHYSRTGTRSVFPALLSAVLTTVAALLVILLLPESEKANLTDFALVIIINLSVSLLVSYLFVPALLDFFPVSYAEGKAHSRRLRRTVRWNRFYGRYIAWGVRHKWVLVLAFIVMFGIPTCLLPTRFGDSRRAPLKEWQITANKVLEWHPYADNKAIVDKVIGSSFALFHKAMSHSDFYREPSRQMLTIRAGMLEGCTVHQLNEVMRSMENYLAGIDEIEVFETRVLNYDDGLIQVLFKPEYEGTWLPSKVKGDVIQMATNFGGANWSVYGINDSYFNNNIVSDNKSSSITLTGYNYDELVAYGEALIEYLKPNRRVSEPEIYGSGWNSRPRTEFNLRYDFEALDRYGISPYEYYSVLQSPLYGTAMMRLPQDGEYVNVRLESSAKDEFDAWHINNEAVAVGDTRVKLSEVGGISKDRTGIPIEKENQSYAIKVSFNFIGSYQLATKVIDDAVAYMNGEILPIGFKAENSQGGWFYSNQEKYAGLILLVIALIFIICSIHFNSLRLPLAIIFLIPISFVGLFLAFGIGDFTFDKGGFAAFIMLSGISVNAGIYLVSEYLHTPPRPDCGIDAAIRAYLRAFDRKIIPIALTILSTVLGLIPFLFDGPTEVFWFAFAVGTIVGILFSIVALILYLPVFALKAPKFGG